jgi:transposase
MPRRVESLPTNIAALQAIIAKQSQLLEQKDVQLQKTGEQLQASQGQVLHFATWVEKLKLQIAILKRQRFGKSSEQLDTQIAQLEFILDDWQMQQGEHDVLVADNSPIAKAPESIEQPEVVKQRRKLLPEHLPRETHTHAITCACSECGATQWRLVGEDVSEVLELIPARFKVIRHVRPKYSCGACQVMAQVPATGKPLGKSPVGAGLLAHVLVSKYQDHLPLYRQSQMYERLGVELERATLAEWVGGASALLKPLTEAIKKHVLAANKLHGDDTPVPVLQPGRNTTKQGRLWGYCRDDSASGEASPPAVWFTYTPDRKAVHPQGHLRNWEGVLQADGYAGYNELYKTGAIKEAACWAHARRKFNDLLQATDSPVAKQALEKIAQLYAIEKAIRGKPKEQRLAQRQKQSVPLLAEYHAWLKAQFAAVLSKSGLGLAIAYSLNRWQALIYYAQDGQVEMDNNIIEREIRPIALGKKNWLFAGSDNGGHRAAAMYALLNTAKLNGINPKRYLEYVLARINDHKINQIDQLLPWNVTLAKESSTESTEQSLAA